MSGLGCRLPRGYEGRENSPQLSLPAAAPGLERRLSPPQQLRCCGHGIGTSSLSAAGPGGAGLGLGEG